MLPVPFEIIKTTRETKDTFNIELKPENEFKFIPGQFNMLYLFGVGEVPISISGDPDKPEKLIHTIRNVGTVTNLISKLKKNDVIGVRGPFGNPWPVEHSKGKDMLIIAGGLGLAPVRPLIYQILNHREEFDNVTILYGAREPKGIIFEKELHKWRSRFDIEVELTVDFSASSWHGNIGVITSLIKRLNIVPDKAIAMICGPEIMMRFSALELENKGVKSENIYLSMERNMKCAIGFCGHCQFGSEFVCKNGPVFPYKRIKNLLTIREL